MNCPNLVSELYTPKVVWYQTDVTVIMRILLHDVNNYFLHVECDHLLFSATVNAKHYYICLYLFGTVVAEKTTHVNIGREIRIYLVKAHKWTEWLRLQIERERNPLIVVDPDHLCSTKWTFESLKCEERESFAEYKRKHNIKNILPDISSTDEEESEDEIMNELFY